MAKKQTSRLPESVTTVTTMSKVMAAVLFITLPFVAFAIGMQYGLMVCQL